jgi:hypothetical protein
VRAISAILAVTLTFVGIAAVAVLRRLWTSIESRTGRVETVTAERGRAAGEAYGILGTRDGSFPVRLRSTLERGEWRLDELNSLEALASRL